MLSTRRISQIFNTDLPLALAPMAGAADVNMAIAVAQAGGLGSLACAMLSPEQIRNEVQKFREACGDKPLNLNFFCHPNIPLSVDEQTIWLETLSPYYKEFLLDLEQEAPFPERHPFDESTCKLMEELKPEVISFHFGLPDSAFMTRLKNIGCKILSSATTVEEALWLEEKGCDAIIAQGLEAGGHRALFLTDDLSTQLGTMALVPLIVDRVKVPIIAAGGIADGRGVVAAFALGASAVQIGSAYLLTNESKISVVHRNILLSEASQNTALTNLFSGRPARGVVNRLMQELGPISSKVPVFPYAGKALAPLKAVTEEMGSGDFMSLWTGQNLRKDLISAEELTLRIWEEVTDTLEQERSY